MNLLNSDDLSKEDIEGIFSIADDMSKGKDKKYRLDGASLTLFFEKTSTRTRMSFEVAMTQLGGHAIYIDPSTTQRSRGETLADTTRMFSGYCDLIAARLYKHADLLEIARNSTVPVINALTDIEHPTQALADVYTIRVHKKNMAGLRIAFVGDTANNTANSLMVVAAKLGAETVLIGPKGYSPNMDFVKIARKYSNVEVADSLEKGLKGVDAIYTDTFVSMGQEAEAEKRRKLFAPYQVNSGVFKYAKSDAIVLHCLPAHRGEEITSDVLDGPKSVVWEQARNKMLLNKAIMAYLSKR